MVGEVGIDTRRNPDTARAAGVHLVWVADPEKRTVRVHRSLTDFRELSEKDTLTGGAILPGFRVPVANLFAD